MQNRGKMQAARNMEEIEDGSGIAPENWSHAKLQTRRQRELEEDPKSTRLFH